MLLLEPAHTASTAAACLTTRRWNTWSLDYQHCAELLDNTTMLGNMGEPEHWNIWTGPISCYAVETAPEVRRPRGPSTQAGRHRLRDRVGLAVVIRHNDQIQGDFGVHQKPRLHTRRAATVPESARPTLTGGDATEAVAGVLSSAELVPR